jgi:hypothetical protein
MIVCILTDVISLDFNYSQIDVLVIIVCDCPVICCFDKFYIQRCWHTYEYSETQMYVCMYV